MSASVQIEEKTRVWAQARDLVKVREEHLHAAQIDETNARIKLAKAILPKDFEVNEKIGIWVNARTFNKTGDVLLQIVKLSEESYEIKVRD